MRSRSRWNSVRALGAGSNHFTGGFVTQQQCEGVDENGFSGAGFTGEQIEAGGELDRRIVDDRVVFDP